MRGRKISGGKYKKIRKRKLHEVAGKIRAVKLGKEKKKMIKLKGGTYKTVLLSTDKANVFNTKSNRSKIAKIKNVVETPSDRFLARQNIMTKGAIIDTDLGKARIKNRPSQEAVINAVLIEDTK